MTGWGPFRASAAPPPRVSTLRELALQRLDVVDRHQAALDPDANRAVRSVIERVGNCSIFCKKKSRRRERTAMMLKHVPVSSRRSARNRPPLRRGAGSPPRLAPRRENGAGPRRRPRPSSRAGEDGERDLAAFRRVADAAVEHDVEPLGRVALEEQDRPTLVVAGEGVLQQPARGRGFERVEQGQRTQQVGSALLRPKPGFGAPLTWPLGAFITFTWQARQWMFSPGWMSPRGWMAPTGQVVAHIWQGRPHWR